MTFILLHYHGFLRIKLMLNILKQAYQAKKKENLITYQKHSWVS